MKKIIQSISGMVCLSLLIAACSEPEKPAVASSPADQILKGKEIFETQCTSCHGKYGADGMNGAKNLQTSVLSRDQMIQKLNTGGNGMPAFQNMLGEEKIRDVVAYIRTLHK